MRAEHIEHLVELSRPAVHPDGWAVVAASRPDVDANRTVGQLWRVSLADGGRTRITQGVSDSSPQLTPDGTRILFVRADAKGRPQVWVMPADGGEPVQTTDAPGGVTGFRISPDGARLALTVREVEPGRGSTVEGLTPEAQSPRRIVDLHAQRNGVGYRIDARSRVAVADILDPGLEPDYERAPAPGDAGAEHPPTPTSRIPEAATLTSGDVEHVGAVWSADGTEVLAIRVDSDARTDLRNPIVAIRVDGGEERELLGIDANLSVAQIVADAHGVWAIAQDVGESGIDFVARNAGLYRLVGSTLERRTDEETIDLAAGDLTLVDDGVLVQDTHRGRVHVLHVGVDGVTRLTGDATEATGVAVHGDRIVVTVQTPTSFGELGLVEPGEDGPGGVRILTDFGAALQAAGVTVPTEHDLVARDGSRVHGWVWLPEGEGPHPVLLNIHGGPFAQYGVHVFDEAQVAVDAGYAVVQCNPRGSAGYGRAHGLAIRQRMGTVDLHDVLDFLDGALAAHPSLDGDRVGIMGGSYGGYLTAWTIAHEHRFRAAIVERGFLDPESFVGTSDIGSFFGDEYVGTDPERVRAQSPMAVVSQVRTPTLVVHAERDLRCPLEQAQRYFAALHRQGTEAELLVFPGEDHELTRSGQPRHRIERFAAVLDWFGRHIPA
ncbi:S9 family peptidase [Agrococcus sp. SGAir0287]|uniref:S9 family peptidase n=1 Tax=Agrococcus sp. SGAir0287 TaxID=2070347 RepID=UPI0010CCCF21|nr:S9 family peptidase [Agrococcus sp. SGAir0287]QCR19205.1 S9 family peptidase [Agrococcus sp. SGAir0287]